MREIDMRDVTATVLVQIDPEVKQNLSSVDPQLPLSV